MKQSDDRAVPSVEAREYVRGRKPDDPEPHEHAGIVQDGAMRRLLDRMVEAYQPKATMPAEVRDTSIYTEILASEAGDTLSEAVRAGNPTQQSYMAGDPARSSDISGLKAINTIKDEIMGKEAPIVYIFGEMGTGKTSLGLLLAQIWTDIHSDKETEIGTNIRTLEQKDKWLPSYPELKDWLGENTKQLESGGTTQVEDASRKLVIFDEASSTASGRSQHAHEVGEKLAPMVYKIRKANAGLIIIGHDGKDVHPAVRELATVIQKRRDYGKKRAWIYESVRNRQGENLIAELSGIPDTDWRFDTNEATSFEWKQEEEQPKFTKEEAEEMAEEMSEKKAKKFAVELAYQSDMTQKDVAKTFGRAIRGKPYTQSAIPRWKSKYFDGDNILSEEEDN